jgi:hypothetical protein
MGSSLFAVVSCLLGNLLLTSVVEAADVFIDFGDPDWDSQIENSDHAENRYVGADPETGDGYVLVVDYDRSTLYGSQFDYPAFTQEEDPNQACLYYEVFFDSE